jgi:hypothetical protein
MCTLVILRRPGHDWPVIIAANRDEMVDRAWRPPARHWPDRDETVGGLDELAGGSWLAVNEHGLIAGILNRVGSLGPQAGRRSRGEIVLEALDHADAAAAAEALGALEPSSYRPFNLILADNRDAFWLRHADPTGTVPLTATALPEGLSMITAGDLDDPTIPRIRAYLPRFRAAAPPDPGVGDWRDWQALLASDDSLGAEPNGAMSFNTAGGFATVSSAMLALPAPGRPGVRPIFRFATRRPTPSEWQDVPV